jgi:hypothetical protein
LVALDILSTDTAIGSPGTDMTGRAEAASPTNSKAQMCRPDRALLAPQPAHDCGLQHGFSRIRQVIFLPYWINIVQDGDVQFVRVLHGKFAAEILDYDEEIQQRERR